MSTSEPPLRLTRRGVLVLGGLGAAAVAGGGWALSSTLGAGSRGTMTPEVRERPVALERSALRRRTAIGSATHHYEVDGTMTPYYVQDAFAATLTAWMATHRTLTGQRPDAVHSYGAWTNGDGTSWHHSGQALDVARLRTDGRDVASLRYDRWRDDTSAEVRRRLRTYWQVAAGLHLHFADVLTYLFDAAHANHIHVDSGRFGPGGTPRLIPRSGAQVQAVQAMCVHVWGRSQVQLTGDLDGPTRDATTAILRDHGGTGELTDGVEAWQAFLRATMRQARDA